MNDKWLEVRDVANKVIVQMCPHLSNYKKGVCESIYNDCLPQLLKDIVYWSVVHGRKSVSDSDFEVIVDACKQLDSKGKIQ